MASRPETELDRLASRVAHVLSERGLMIKPSDVDLVLFAELCWALGVEPTVVFAQIMEADNG